MTLPGETEAGSAGMQPCRGIAWWAHRDDVAGRGSSPFALYPKTHRIGRPLCLENPRPEGAEYSLTESELSPLHAEPAQLSLAEPQFDVLLTLDKNIPYQQDLKLGRIAILIVRAPVCGRSFLRDS